jgi:hypothetical protein
MKVANVQFKEVVSFDGQQKSASSSVAANGDRPGATPCEIEFDPESMTFSLSKNIKGIPRVKFVHVSNVTGWELLPEVKKEEKKPEAKK